MLRRAMLGLVAGAALAAPARGQTADDLIARSCAARGGIERMQAVGSVRMKGRMSMGPQQEASFVIEKRRPRSTRMEISFQGTSSVQAYDGQQAWGIPPTGARKPEPMPREMAQELDNQADFDGPLVDYQAKGHKVELLGREKLESGEAWKLKVTLRSGDLLYVFLDAGSHLEIRHELRRAIRGVDVEIETTIGDYREAGGLLWPRAIRFGAKGRPERQSLVFESIEVNPVLDDARFTLPRQD